jgi:hypothetical protein
MLVIEMLTPNRKTPYECKNETLPGACLQASYIFANPFPARLPLLSIKASYPIIYLKKTMTV